MKKRYINKYLCAVVLLIWQMYGYGQSCDSYSDDVRILVAYTQDVENQYPGEVLEKLIQPSIDNINLAYANSGISHRVKLVRAIQIDFPENNSTATNLDEFCAPDSKIIGGECKNYEELRATYHADIMFLLLVKGDLPGLAVRRASKFNGNAFGVATTDKLVSLFKMAHEIGHIYGCKHEIEIDPTEGTGHGYRFNNIVDGAGNKAHDIMAYGNDNGLTIAPIPYFSDPSKTYQGYARGTVNANATEMINDRYSQIKGVVVGEPINITKNETIKTNEMADVNAFSNLNINSNFVIEGNASTYLRVGMKSGHDGIINLKPGFHAKAGSYMRAYTCSSTTNARVLNDEQAVKKVNSNTPLDQASSKVIIYPNPFNDKVSIKYTLDKDQPVNLMFYDIAGKQIGQSIIDTPQTAGEHEFIFDGSTLSKGIYIYKLSIDGAINTGKIIKEK